MAWSGRSDTPFLVATQPKGARAVLSAIGDPALSPGVNDPCTAVNCIDWMGAELVEPSRGASAGASLQAVEGARRDLQATFAHPRRQLRRGSA